MTCDCFKKWEQHLTETHRSKAGPGVQAQCQIASEFEGKIFMSVPFRIKGSLKGYRSAFGKSVSVLATFCPFCGTKLREG